MTCGFSFLDMLYCILPNWNTYYLLDPVFLTNSLKVFKNNCFLLGISWKDKDQVLILSYLLFQSEYKLRLSKLPYTNLYFFNIMFINKTSQTNLKLLVKLKCNLFNKLRLENTNSITLGLGVLGSSLTLQLLQAWNRNIVKSRAKAVKFYVSCQKKSSARAVPMSRLVWEPRQAVVLRKSQEK